MGQKPSTAPTPLSLGMATAIELHLVRRKLRRKDLVTLAGRSEPYWSNRLNGKASFTLADIENLAKGFGVDPHDLVADAVREIPR